MVLLLLEWARGLLRSTQPAVCIFKSSCPLCRPSALYGTALRWSNTDAGEARPWGRRLDYWVCFSSVASVKLALLLPLLYMFLISFCEVLYSRALFYVNYACTSSLKALCSLLSASMSSPQCSHPLKCRRMLSLLRLLRKRP